MGYSANSQSSVNVSTECDSRHRFQRGFTILEVLIALATALVLMLALARTYRYMSVRITDRQADLEMSGVLRDVSSRLRSELALVTPTMTPPAKAGADEGYFMIHEGPFTENTAIRGSAPYPAQLNANYLQDSRYGDIDDYLAFTVTAPGDAMFRGVIPWGVLAALEYYRTGVDPGVAPGDTNFYTNASGNVLVPFFSKTAEVAYWMSPSWQRDALGNLQYDPTTGAPLYIDRDGDFLPDRMNLHRRVLLVRPDLALTRKQMNPQLTTPFVARGEIPFLVNNSGNLSIVPLTERAGVFPQNATLAAPGAWTANQSAVAPVWMTGLAHLQQIMDLSLSRITDNWSEGSNVNNYGMPSRFVKPNSLGDLTRPENRFGHVRMPMSLVDGTAGASTMPVLALCPPHPYLESRRSSPPILSDPSSPLITVRRPTTFPSQTGSGTAIGRFTMTTFLRPEFNLADRVSDVAAGGTGSSFINRGGTDIIATEVVGFDVKAFDPLAPIVEYLPGRGTTTLGAAEIIPPSSPRIEEVLTGRSHSSPNTFLDVGIPVGNPPGGQMDELMVMDRGDFVDIGYTRLAGGSMGGFIQFDSGGNLVSTVNQAWFLSNFSGFGGGRVTSVTNSANATYQSTFPVTWENSGRFIVPTVSAGVEPFYQPVYDTWTDSYTTDAFDQEGRQGSSSTYVVPVRTYVESRVAPDNGGTVQSANRSVVTRRWTSNRLPFLDLNNELNFVENLLRSEQITFTESFAPIVTTAPIPDPLQAVQITIRLNDLKKNAIRQQTVIQEF